MSLERLEFQKLQIPFKLQFSHASATRGESTTVWVEARTSDGCIGYGEACPRTYVTGETVESARDFFERNHQELCGRVAGLRDLQDFISDRRLDIDANPAAFAAIELALLDAFARSRQCSVEALLGLPELGGVFRYSAVIGTGSLAQFEGLLGQYAELGLEDLKLKLSGDLDLDRKKLGMADARGMRLRVDANNLWRSVDEACRYIKLLKVSLVGVEEPLQPDCLVDLAMISRSCETRVILDESLLRIGQVSAIGELPGLFIANLRVSKLGGLLRSLEVMAAVREIGVPVVVGAHVGETSLLTRAALTLASAAGDSLFAQEGAFGTRLLAVDPCRDPLMFGHRGQLLAPNPGHGLGLEICDAFGQDWSASGRAVASRLRRPPTSPQPRGQEVLDFDAVIRGKKRSSRG